MIRDIIRVVDYTKMLTMMKAFVAFLTAVLLVLALSASGFSPVAVASSSGSTATSRLVLAAKSNALDKQASVLVVGGTGGVGQLVTQKLVSAGYSVSVSSRNVENAKEVLGDGVGVVPLDVVQGSQADVSAALEGPQAAVVSVGTTAFPTLKWANGNTPEAIDKDAVVKIANAAAKSSTLRKIVLLTSVGVDRTDQMPFLILNLFKVLDCKKAGEQAIMNSGVDYAIVRPGRLVGGPYTNPDIAKLLQVPGGAENGVDVAPGDNLLGDCSRDACAEAVVQCLVNPVCSKVDFSIISNENPALTEDEWTQAFNSM